MVQTVYSQRTGIKLVPEKLDDMGIRQLKPLRFIQNKAELPGSWSSGCQLSLYISSTKKQYLTLP